MQKLQGIEIELPKVQSLDYKKRAQVDLFSIPSTRCIMQMNVFESGEERQKFARSSLDDVRFDFENPDVEGPLLLQQILPSLSSLEASSDGKRTINDYTETKYAQILRYYQHLENIV